MIRLVYDPATGFRAKHPEPSTPLIPFDDQPDQPDLQTVEMTPEQLQQLKQEEIESRYECPESVKQMLLWAFSETGALDDEMFLEILQREHVYLSPSTMLQLHQEVSERVVRGHERELELAMREKITRGRSS